MSNPSSHRQYNGRNATAIPTGCTRWGVGIVLAGLAVLAGSCAGPQPLGTAIKPQDEQRYVAELNAVDLDARQAYVNWMTQERGITPAEYLQADAALSTTRNPFNANRDAQAVSRGAVVFKLHCARCHGDDARGNGPSLLPGYPARDFHAFSQRFAATLHGGAPRRWFRVITAGSGDEVDYPDGRARAMPAFGDKLTREQVWLVITYLQSLDVYAK